MTAPDSWEQGGADRRQTPAIEVMFARLEAKLDVALAQHGAKIEQHGQEISELRTLYRKMEDRPIAQPEGLLDHEERIREIEKRPTVSPRQLWTTFATAAGLVIAFVPLLDRLYGAV